MRRRALEGCRSARRVFCGAEIPPEGAEGVEGRSGASGAILIDCALDVSD